MGAPALRLPSALRARLARGAGRAHRREVCGLLLGRRTADAIEVVRLQPARNLDPAPERFELDPAAHVRAEDRARAEGLEVVGLWHSHPDRPARPSGLDRARAWGGWSYLIVATVAGGPGELRAWRLADGVFVEQPLL